MTVKDEGRARHPGEPAAGEPDENRRGVLSRWSRRKAAIRAGEPVDEPFEALPATVPEAADADTAESEAALAVEPEAAPLPVLTELDGDSDYSAFLAEKVPAAVRKQALRQLFAAAKFNIVDGLDDYDDDFRQILPLGDIVTSDMKHQAEVQAQRAREKAEEEARKAALGSEEEADEEQLDAIEADDAALEDADVEARDTDDAAPNAARDANAPAEPDGDPDASGELEHQPNHDTTDDSKSGEAQ